LIPPLDEDQRLRAEIFLRDRIVGLPLTDMWRFGGFQVFEIGPQLPFVNKKGQQITRAEMSFHILAEWSLQKPSFGLSWEHFGDPRSDGFAKDFYLSLSSSPPVISDVKIFADGSLRVQFEDQLVLHVEALREEGLEWRFLPGESEDHLVVCVPWSPEELERIGIAATEEL
jgi:hypothetical protein